MQQVMIPLSEGAYPMICPNHKQPIPRGSFLAYEVTDTEYNFWKTLTNQERTKLRDETYHHCFYDLLHEAMRRNKRLFHEGR